MEDHNNRAERLDHVVVILPSLHPDGALCRTVGGLLDVGFKNILLVDDGSGEEYAARFEECVSLGNVTLLRHEVNRGKGAALKTAFSYVLESMPDITAAVTADGDGQHLPEDVKKCVEACLDAGKCVLGVRDFSLPEVPAHNRRGNRITSFVFRLFCGIKCSDTQTGLRAFPREALKLLVKTKGDRYEYETQMLLDFKTYRVPFEEVTIHTVYLDDNKSSHFRIFKDSFRIYRMILAHFFKYSASSILSVLLETLVIFLILGKTEADLSTNAVAFLIARGISSFFNMNVNYFAVFRAKCSYPKAAARYYALAIPVAAVTLGFNMLLKWGVKQLDFLPETVERYSLTVINLIVQAIIFIFTFRMQQRWVYKTDRSRAYGAQNADTEGK